MTRILVLALSLSLTSLFGVDTSKELATQSQSTTSQEIQFDADTAWAKVNDSISVPFTSSEEIPADFALSFDGVDDYVDLGDMVSQGAYTKVAWVKRETGGGNNNIVSGNTGHAFWAPNEYDYKLAAGHNNAWGTVKDNVALVVGEWFLVAVTYDPNVASGTMKLYKNGNQIATATGVPIQQESTTTYVGRFNNGNHYLGSIDEVTIWNRALTQEEIQNSMSSEFSGDEDGLQGYWKFNEGSGNIAYDQSGNGNDGVLNNMDLTSAWSFQQGSGLTVTIMGQDTSISTINSDQFRADYTTTVTDPEGEVQFEITFADLAENEGEDDRVVEGMVDFSSPDIVASVEPILLEKEQPQITESKINENFISIQPINRGELKPMEVEIISGIIYDEILELGLKDVMNPNRFIPDSIRINKLVELIRFKSDTLINKKKETTDTLITLDTLMFHELVDTVLYYNFDCKSDSCAAENALLEGVGQVLSWGINEYSELEVHFFSVSQHLNNDPIWVWTSSLVVLDPDASEKLHYPEALAVAENGTLLIAAANDQAVYELNINQQASTLTRNLALGQLLHPSGIDIGPKGLIYISDRDNHRLFSKLGKEYVSLLTPETNKDGSIKQNQPLFPTKIRVGPGGDIYVLYEGNDSVVKLDKDYRVSLVLQPSVINGIRDIAVNSKDNLFVVSPSTNRVFRVINDSTVVPFAGMEKTDNMVKDNIKATDSFLGLPVAIDFDSADQLYIGDKKFGLVRRVDSEGMITTLFGINNKVEGISDLRVSKGPNPKIFITQPLKHQIQRIALERVFHWRTETKINSPKYIIGKNGVYGLEPDIRATVSNVLREKLELPKEKKTFGALLQERNRRISAYIRKHPILFALLLILINQGISASLDGGGSLDLPPDFPSIP